MSAKHDKMSVEIDKEPTLGIFGGVVNMTEAVEVICKAIDEAAELAGTNVRTLFKNAAKTSRHNAELMDALNAGTDFRIAFRKPGATDWTRVRFCEEDLLGQLAREEVFSRQEQTMSALCQCLGVDELELFV